MKKCAVCGRPVESGLVIHSECCPKHAHWVGHLENDSLVGPGEYRCSHCHSLAPINEEILLSTHEIIRYKAPRCMVCGAIMNEEADHEAN